MKHANQTKVQPEHLLAGDFDPNQVKKQKQSLEWLIKLVQ
jgi:hypothetical protein